MADMETYMKQADGLIEELATELAHIRQADEECEEIRSRMQKMMKKVWCASSRTIASFAFLNRAAKPSACFVCAM